MTVTAVRGGGTGFIDYRGVVLSDGRQIAAVTDAITTVSMDYRVGSVAEMQVGLVDADGSLIDRGLLEAGTTLHYFGETFQVAATDLDYRGEAIVAVYSARSRLARRLRNTMGPKTTKGQTPAQWITRKVKDAGGTAVVESGAKRLAIHQKRSESVLDVIANLASDTGTEWCEFAGTVYCGTGWWAYQGRTGLPTWPVSFGRAARTDVTQLSTRSSVDDRLEAASASISVPYSVGSEWRPWHRVKLTGASKNDNGTWLIQDVSFDLHDSSTVNATLYRPLKSSPKNGSTSTADTPSLGGIDGWVPGADTVGDNCVRTPREMVAAGLKQIGTQQGLAGFCQKWVNMIAKNNTTGGGAANGAAEWAYMPSGTPHGTDTTAPAGAVVCYSHPHTAISIGDGQMIGTTDGVRGIQKCQIAGYTSGYLGWKYPNLAP